MSVADHRENPEIAQLIQALQTGDIAWPPARHRVTTAGAYVIRDGRFLFMIGPTKTGDRLGVVRLGGHCEPGETSWESAAREVQEEASLAIRSLPPPCTYRVRNGYDAPPSAEPWDSTIPDPVPPLLVIERWGADAGTLSVMFLASTSDGPIPAGETRGLVLLTPLEVLHLTQSTMTLDGLLRAGGRVILCEALPTHLPLEPFPQLRILATLLAWHPDLASAGTTIDGC